MKKFISKNGVTSQSQSLSGSKPASDQTSRSVVGRRSFLKGLGATGSTGAQTQVVHPAPGTVLRQDNPAGQSTGGDTQSIRGVRGGHGDLP